MTRYDLDGRTLEEQPDLVLGALLCGSEGLADEAHANAVAARLRGRVTARLRLSWTTPMSRLSPFAPAWTLTNCCSN